MFLVPIICTVIAAQNMASFKFRVDELIIKQKNIQEVSLWDFSKILKSIKS